METRHNGMTDRQKELQNERNRRWRRAHPDRMKAARKSWEIRHPEQRAAILRSWVVRNPKKVQSIRDRYEKRHPKMKRLIARKHRERWVGELRPGYVRQLARQTGHTVETQRLKTMIHRSKRTFSALAVANLLNP